MEDFKEGKSWIDYNSCKDCKPTTCTETDWKNSQGKTTSWWSAESGEGEKYFGKVKILA